MNNKLLTIVFVGFIFFILPMDVSANRLWSSGCEFQGDNPAIMIGGLEWEAISTLGNLFISTDTVLSGLSSCRAASTTDTSSNFQFSWTSGNEAGDIFVRFYLNIATAPSEDINIFTIWNRGVDGLEGALMLETDRQLHWVDDEGNTDGQGSTVLGLNTWFRIDIHYNSGSVAIVQLDGVEELSAGTHTGDSVDTILFGFCGSFSVCGDDGAQVDIFFDDIAVNDDSGSNQTSFPGAGSIVHMQPNASGDNNGCSAGDDTDVDEITPDDATTICVLDANSDILDVNVESSSSAGIGSSDTITVVQVGVRQAGASTGVHGWNMRVKSASGGTTSSGSAQTANTASYYTQDSGVPRTYSLTSYTDPTTSVAWTPTGTNSLDNMQVGITATDATPDINVTTLWALVEYVDVEPAGAEGDEDIIWFFMGSLLISSLLGLLFRKKRYERR